MLAHRTAAGERPGRPPRSTSSLPQPRPEAQGRGRLYNGHSILAVIPARAGSKRLVGKNTLPFRGRPLLVWTIESAVACPYLDRIILSSDIDFSPLTEKYGITYHRRPPALADDAAPIEAVVKDILWNTTNLFDLVLLLQPTSPLRTTIDINSAIEQFFHSPDSVISFSYTEWPSLRPNGAIYLMRTDSLLEGMPFYGLDNAKIQLTPPDRTADINTAEDLQEAEKKCGY